MLKYNILENYSVIVHFLGGGGGEVYESVTVFNIKIGKHFSTKRSSRTNLVTDHIAFAARRK
jgi:hypothetical protein